MPIFLIDKPSGVTSATVVRQIKSKFNVRKAGHAGTLDPLATGLLIIATDQDTKKLYTFLKLSKTYLTTFFLGASTLTNDREGEIDDEDYARAWRLSDAEVVETTQSLVGNQLLPVPAYSAVKREGKPLYKYARAGEKIDLPVKPMTVLSISNVKVRRTNEGVFVDAEIAVESGVYIRSLAVELGRRLHVPAMLWSLRRIVIGDFSVLQAKMVDQITADDLLQ